MRFRVVEIFAVAGQAAQQHTLVFFVPVVDRQHDVALVDAPRIGQSRDEGACRSCTSSRGRSAVSD